MVLDFWWLKISMGIWDYYLLEFGGILHMLAKIFYSWRFECWSFALAQTLCKWLTLGIFAFNEFATYGYQYSLLTLLLISNFVYSCTWAAGAPQFQASENTSFASSDLKQELGWVSEELNYVEWWLCYLYPIQSMIQLQSPCGHWRMAGWTP